MSQQAKVGVVVLIAIMLLGIVVTWKSSLLLKFTGYEMIGSFENIEGLTVGSEVRYRGLKVGKAMRIDPGPDDIKVYCNIDKEIKFPADSTLRVAFDGLVGLKFLEIRPGKSAELYKSSQILFGQRTSSIVDFVDLGAQNLVETKKILVAIKSIIERPDIQAAFVNAVLNVEKLTEQLKIVTQSLNNVVSDRNFQENFKGTVAGTNKTLTSAGQFFEGFSNIRIKASGDVLLGGLANQVKGNLDIKPNPNVTWKFSLGEGPTRNLSLLDAQVSNVVAKNLALRIGMINTHLGGGIDMLMNRDWTVSSDIYDVNNPKPSYPKVRLTSDYKVADYVNLLLQADDIINTGNTNYSFGVRVKGLD